MALIPSHLGARLVWTSAAFLIIVALVTGFLVQSGFAQTERTATNNSVEGLSNESRQKLLAVTQGEALLATTQFQQAADMITLGRDQFLITEQLPAELGKPVSQLERDQNGVYFDPDPDRRSDVWIPIYVTPTTQLDRELRASANLDTLLPSMLQQYPGAAALVFTAAEGWARYYPPIGLHEIVPPDFPVTNELFFQGVIPEKDPQRTAIWTPPYLDPAGQGLLTTVSIPIYRGDTFVGVINMDVSLNRVIERLQTIKSTPSSAAFLVDGAGHLVAAAPAALDAITSALTDTAILGGAPANTQSVTQTLGLDLAQSPTGQTFLNVIKPDQAGIEIVDRGDNDVFVSYAPVAGVGWSLVVVTPVSDVVGQAQQVSQAIQAGTRTTIIQTLVTLAVLFLLAIVAVAILSRNLTRPLIRLADAVNQVSQGDLKQDIEFTNRKDEIGDLQRSFKRMLAELGAQREALEQRNTQLQDNLTKQDQMSETIQKLSTPILPLLDNVLVLPIVGRIDTRRAQDLMNTLLQGVHNQRARTVIIDITGVPVVDDEVMKLLLKATRAVQLLGSQVILAGISAEIAQFIARQGIAMGGVQTQMNLHTAIQSVLKSQFGFETSAKGRANAAAGVVSQK